MSQSAESIFVQIASYRDSECKNTIDDLFNKAASPENIFVGLNWQYAKEDGFIPFFEKEYQDRIRIIRYPYHESEGACWARHIVQSLYRGETYTLQIDAHMRFTQGWDNTLINMYLDLQRQGYAKPILSFYPPDYSIKDGQFGETLKKMAPFPRPDSIFVFQRTGHLIELGEETMPLLTPCLSANFLFANGNSITDVPYDPHLYFMGEEITLAVRLWTRGWDIFNPARIIAYHLYKHQRDTGTGEVHKARDLAVHQIDNQAAKERNELALKRVRHLLGTKKSKDPRVLKDIEAYSIGTVRSIHQYEQFAGIRFTDMSKTPYARFGMHFAEKIPLGSEVEATTLIESEVKSRMLFNENATQQVIALSDICRILKVHSLIDIGATLVEAPPLLMQSISTLKYFGISIDMQRVDTARMDMRACHNVILAHGNYVAAPLPCHDMVFCYDLLQRIPVNLAWQILKNIGLSNSIYLCVLQSTETASLTSDPFHIPPPKCYFKTQSDDSVFAIWIISEIITHLDGMPADLSLLRRQLINGLERALKTLCEALISRPDFFIKLLEVIVSTSGEGAKQLLKQTDIQELLRANNYAGEKAKDMIMALRWKVDNPVLNDYIYVQNFDRLFAAAVTCEYIEGCQRATLAANQKHDK